MIAYSELLREWHRRQPTPTYNSMSFVGNGLFLGAGTRLAALKNDGPLEFDIGGEEERILALLSVAYWLPIPTHVLTPINRAVRAYARNEKTLAYIHLAHAKLPRIEGGHRDFFRLFCADRLLSAGVAPLELLEGLDIDTTPIRLLKASVDDPKHPGWPAGTPGGQGGRFRPNDSDAPEPNVPAATPVADFSGGFHDAVVDSWMAYFATIGVPAVKNPAIRLVGSEGEVFGYPDIMANVTQLGGLVVIEVKTGDNPTLTPNQSLYLQLFQIGGHVYTTDERITRLAHTPNVPFPPMDVYILYAPGPNLPYAVAKLPPPKFHKSVVNLRGHLGT